MRRAVMADIRSKALGYLRDGNVMVFAAKSMDDGCPPVELSACVRGHNAVYVVDLTVALGWMCSCGRERCAHVAAVQLVTGHRSPAAKRATS